eukprot:CAMPEP_0172204990 /NCGR_PEP_ID=MMETSP1050-20130122/32323_1 /TAXON_ID=233186 /ORGANISM="Cryptomonas curvata, Strain CCAP979/52" /LENGTH=332 /DNA_ID=CAMNT_0012883731 /DNA_START=469 /DNA_END=1464 /DNA_ORIENTATION=-
MDEETRKKVKPVYIDSWILDEFRAAFDCTKIFDRFKKNLDSGLAIDGQTREDLTKEDLIMAKYYFAGTCARYMFAYTSEAVISNITDSISACSDILPYLEGSVGEHAVYTINRLISTKTINERGRLRRENSLVSRFAASELALKFGPDLVKRIADTLRNDLNPVMEGFLFEMWFFALINRDGIRCHGKDTVYNFEHENLLRLDPSKKVNCPGVKKAWYKPLNWNQGGYDAVHVDFENRIVTFFQITISIKHSLKLEHMSSLLKKMTFQAQKGGSDLKPKVEIFFLVPESQVDIFKISSSSGTLVGYENSSSEKWTARNSKSLFKVVSPVETW